MLGRGFDVDVQKTILSGMVALFIQAILGRKAVDAFPSSSSPRIYELDST